MESIAPTPPPDACTVGAGARDLIEHLTRAVDRLWRAEPDVAPSQRSRLLERLALLEHDVVRMSLQHQADGRVDGELLRGCLAEADELRWWWRPTGRDNGRTAA